MKKRIAIGLVVVVTLAIVATGYFRNSAPEPPEKETLSLTINSWIGWAPLYLAKDKGLLNGVDLVLTRVEDAGPRKSTMMAGHVDGYASSVDNFALDSAEGVPGKIVLCFDESSGGDGIVVKKQIAKPADLKGKQIAFQKGLPSHFLLLTVLAGAGLSPDDVQQVDMDADKAGAAFTSGKLDAAVTWEPWISKAAAISDGRILVTTRDYPGLIVDALVIREPVLQSKSATVSSVVNGWFRALDYWKAHVDESDQLMAKAYGLSVEDFRGMCSGITFYDLSRNKQFFGPDAPGPIYKVFESAAVLWQQAKVTAKRSDAASRVDSSFVRALK